MAPDGVVEAVDIAGNGCRGFSARVQKTVRHTSSDLMVLKNVSTIALSKQLPLADIEMAMP